MSYYPQCGKLVIDQLLTQAAPSTSATFFKSARYQAIIPRSNMTDSGGFVKVESLTFAIF
jgi:hypothetical protein